MFILYILALIVCGCFAGLFVEYGIHRFLHMARIKQHTDHHKEFFLLEPSDVARRSHPLVEYSVYAAIVFLVLSPLTFLLGF